MADAPRKTKTAPKRRRFTAEYKDSILKRLEGLEGRTESNGSGTLLVGPTSPRNAATLRRHLEWLQPAVPGR